MADNTDEIFNEINKNFFEHQTWTPQKKEEFQKFMQRRKLKEDQKNIKYLELRRNTLLFATLIAE